MGRRRKKKPQKYPRPPKTTAHPPKKLQSDPAPPAIDEPTRAEPSDPIRPFRLRIAVKSLELVRGYDGILRGVPEPIVALSAFLLDGDQARPLGRTLVRFSVSAGTFPTTILNLQPTEALIANARAELRARLAVLLLALEEDSGKDIQRVYAHLGEAKHWRMWRLDDTMPSPMAVVEMHSMPLPSLPYQCSIGVVDDGVDLRDACPDDALVGAGLIVLGTGRQEEEFRVRFLSSDERNDWTALVDIRVK